MKSNSGFSLVEIMVAIAILAVLATVVVPNLFKRSALQERKAFIDKLNALTQLGWQQALVKGKVHRLHFDIKQHRAQLAIASDKKDEKGATAFEPVRSYQLSSVVEWPKNISIKNFFIEGYDELGRYAGRATEETWFYMMPEGYTQAVTINMLDVQDKKSDKGKQIGLILNPFTGLFKEYDTFQKP